MEKWFGTHGRPADAPSEQRIWASRASTSHWAIGAACKHKKRGMDADAGASVAVFLLFFPLLVCFAWCWRFVPFFFFWGGGGLVLVVCCSFLFFSFCFVLLESDYAYRFGASRLSGSLSGSIPKSSRRPGPGRVFSIEDLFGLTPRNTERQKQNTCVVTRPF